MKCLHIIFSKTIGKLLPLSHLKFVCKMSIQDYLIHMKKIQASICCFLDNNIDVEESFLNLKKIFDDYKVNKDSSKLKLVLNLISKILDNHHREKDFFQKIEKILLNFKDNIILFFPNWEIFNIFKNNKRVILFLIQQKMITIDETIIQRLDNEKFLSHNYQIYLAPELQPIVKKKVLNI